MNQLIFKQLQWIFLLSLPYNYHTFQNLSYEPGHIHSIQYQQVYQPGYTACRNKNNELAHQVIGLYIVSYYKTDDNRKSQQMANFTYQVKRNMFLIGSALLLFTKLILRLPVVNFTRKEQFFENGDVEGHKINQKTISFIVAFGVVAVLLSIFKLVASFGSLLTKSPVFNLTFNSLIIMASYFVYVSFIKCALTYFELKFMDLFEMKYFSLPLAIGALLMVLSWKISFFKKWWVLLLGYILLGLIIRLMNPLNIAFQWIELAYWSVVLLLSIGIMLPFGVIKEFHKVYLKSPGYIEEGRLSLAAWDIALNVSLFISTVVFEFLILLLKHQIQSKKEREENNGEPLSMEQRIQKQYDNPQKVEQVVMGF